MERPSLYERFHWSLFNMLAKLFGFSVCFVSIVFIVFVISGSLGIREGNEYPVWVLLFLIPLAVVGFLMARVKPFIPAKYQEWYARRNEKLSEKL